ncbi:MAG: aminotransferase class IV [Alicyclobacillaceae bacterium]|nr:aminotransferase class IV [Alicyclobacillaceae bacterium]
MPAIAYVNGQFVDFAEAVVPAEDRGHLFGDGVYEVVRVYGGRPFLLPWHLERLGQSLAAVDIVNPHSEHEWVALIGEAVRRSQEAEATVYWQVTRGAGPRSHAFPAGAPHVTLIVRPFTPSPASQATAVLLPDERWSHVWVKTLNLLPNVIAKETARRAGAEEALFVRAGVLTEGSSSNAWFVRDGTLFTHPADRHILAGVTRRFVLHLAQQAGIPVCERPVGVAELSFMDEVFFTGTTVEVLPVTRILADPDALFWQAAALPADRPATLVRDLSRARVLWERTGAAVSGVAEQLQKMFTQAVERFRNYEDVL